MNFIWNKQQKLLQARHFVRILVDHRGDTASVELVEKDMVLSKFYHELGLINHPERVFALIEHALGHGANPDRVAKAVDMLPIYNNWQREIQKLLASQPAEL